MEKQQRHFRINQIQHDDKLVQFFTGLPSYLVFHAFFEFLEPVVNELNYWGSKSRSHQRHRTCKLDPLTLVKLRLNLKLQDLAFRFGVSETQLSHVT